ncbi:hypothetical protein [Rubinisphaera italica]|uniref:Uncharacterized protein n=1 Tax=Rubinisphaera italica TaxID=2527969 RepID=A0A5C5XF33_9PLAN|nr:hypothetical protein [Rubinisphaera italica]TWT60963.1 hypothetical protein Pan54_16950 [Rubinisphaera italica]
MTAGIAREGFYFLPIDPMARISSLVKAVCGLSKPLKLADGTALPSSTAGWKPIAVTQDRRLCAGVFAKAKRRRKPIFRIIVWRTYRDATGNEKASTVLYPDQVDPTLRLVAQLNERMPSQ